MSVDALARYERALPCTLVPAQDLPDGLRASKDGEELAAMEKAQRITDEAFQAILNFIRPGQTEREVAARLVYELLRRGGERSPSTLSWPPAPMAPNPMASPETR